MRQRINNQNELLTKTKSEQIWRQICTFIYALATVQNLMSVRLVLLYRWDALTDQK